MRYFKVTSLCQNFVWNDQNAPGAKTTENDSDANFKMDFLQEIEAKTHTSKIKRLRDKFKSLNRVLTLEKTKMPLGAKLTQKWLQMQF
jgi:ERCC4-type nuclease